MSDPTLLALTVSLLINVVMIGVFWYLRLSRRADLEQWKSAAIEAGRAASEIKMQLDEARRHLDGQRKTARQLQAVWECFCALIVNHECVRERAPRSWLLSWASLLEAGQLEPMRHWLENDPKSPLFTRR